MFHLTNAFAGITVMVAYVSYLRVSTQAQGQSGLGLDAQRSIVARQIGDAQLIGEYVEVETGKRDDRPQLAAALAHCRAAKATLIVAKLDRLARNARFLLSIVEATDQVVFCDMPTIPSGPIGKFMITQMAAVAELEAGLISARTKDALQAARERGTKLGRPSTMPEAAKQLARDLHAAGKSLRRIADELRFAGFHGASGKPYALSYIFKLVNVAAAA